MGLTVRSIHRTSLSVPKQPKNVTIQTAKLVAIKVYAAPK